MSTLAPPFVAPPPPGQPLVFGAIVAAAYPDTGQRVESTVLRAYPDADGGFVYQVQPNSSDLPQPFLVAERDCALVQGTWWANRADLLEARSRAGIEVAAGEQLTVSPSDVDLRLVASGSDAPPELTVEQRRAALLADVADETTPSMLKMTTHGELTLLGDPDHGWLVVDTDRWLAAMTRDPDELRQTLESKASDATLSGRESKLTLAALAATHAPDDLGPAPLKLVEQIAGATGHAAPEAELCQ
jgi:hypothetical protein